MASDFTVSRDDTFKAENTDLRRLLAQAGTDASRLLAQAGIEAAERDVAEKLQLVLLEELHHRVKNTLATVMAITSQTLRNAENIAQAQEAIAGRLIALGRAHDLLLQKKWVGAAFADILQAAIEPYQTKGATRFVVHGANIEVGATAVLPLAMALNELCTNALKYGALSRPEGQVEIGVTIDEATQRFKLSWREKGGPPVVPPKRRSFGSQLIEKSLARVLHGDAKLQFEPTGVVCEFDFPLESLRVLNPG
jgi:two-component sensor histidine kinase